MKKHLLPALVLLLLAPVSYGEGPANYVPESRASFETFTSKVLKVYSFQEGDLDYIVYVVNWKDHEVVAAPMGARAGEKKYNVGDTIRCTMNQNQLRGGDANRSRISFLVAPSVTDTAARMEAIQAEASARRAQRESAAASPSQPPAPATPSAKP